MTDYDKYPGEDRVHASVKSLGIILGVWAHPDDECYLSGGLMALARESGQRVVCVTATRGERGTDHPDEWPPDRLGPLREKEMQVSMDTLGVVEHRWMDHCDGEVSDVPDAVGVDQIAAVIEEVKPDTLLTFGPDGMTGHSDHITVGRWATVAAENSEHRPRVLHAASDAHLMGVMEHHFSTFPIYMGGRPPLVSRSDAGLALELPERIISQKIAALRAQPSQTEPLLEHMGEQDYREWVSVEVFVDAGKSA